MPCHLQGMKLFFSQLRNFAVTELVQQKSVQYRKCGGEVGDIATRADSNPTRQFFSPAITISSNSNNTARMSPPVGRNLDIIRNTFGEYLPSSPFHKPLVNHRQ